MRKSKKYLFVTIALILTLTLGFIYTFQSNAESVYIKASVLNVREKPDATSPVIAQVRKGETYTYIQKKGDWVEIEIEEGKKGWVAAWLIELRKEAGPAAEATTPDPSAPSKPNEGTKSPSIVEIKAEVVNLRETPSLDAPILGKLMQGTKAALLKQEKDWIEIELVNGKKGWVAGWLVKKTSGSIERKITILTEGTNLRESPSQNGKVIGKGKKGESYSVIDRSGDWYQIRIAGGKSAYVAGWVVAATGIIDEATANGLRGQRIVIDPGHGGKDGGTEGVQTKKQEKDLNLAVALLLEKKLKAEGATVILTRRSDIFLSLEQRVNIAKEASADLFISIHHNKYDTKGMNGTISFYNTKGIEQVLALRIQTELIKATGLKDLSERYGDFHVLRENPVTGALIELGFLSNPSDERKLISPAFQEKEAEGIKNGILRFFSP